MKKLILLIALMLSGCVSAPAYRGAGVNCRGPMPYGSTATTTTTTTTTTQGGTETVTAPPSPSNSIEHRIQGEIDGWMGTPYVYGGVTKRGVDCSGFTQAVYRSVGIEIPRRASRQSAAAETVRRDNLKYGDLIFFNTSGSGISHCGIYLGNGEFVHASSSRGVVRDMLNHPYYSTRYVTGGRFL